MFIRVNRKDQLFNDFRWCLNAVEKHKVNHEYVNYLHINDKHVVCTDAKIFHCFDKPLEFA